MTSISGVLNVIKPTGMTSFDVVAYLRRIIGIKKIGHCGTLDPSATGVLPVCLGSATGLTGYLGDIRKSYRAEILFGVSTDSMDLDGRIIKKTQTCVKADTKPDRPMMESILYEFIGKQMQIPPMYSAIKVNGKRLYDLAREGIEISRSEREITVYSLKLAHVLRDRAIIDVECSKGTYVRSLCCDIGKRLGYDSCMSFLIRTSAAGLYIEDAHTLKDIMYLCEENRLEEIVIKPEELLRGFAGCQLTNSQISRFLNGVGVNLADVELQDADRMAFDQADGSEHIIKVYNNNTFYALAKLVSVNGENILRMKKLFKRD